MSKKDLSYEQEDFLTELYLSPETGLSMTPSTVIIILN